KAIETEVSKTTTATLKALSTCDAAYRKDTVKPTTPPFAKAAPACQKALDKTFGTTGQALKSLGKLVNLVPKTCTDADLGSLGHPVMAAVGDVWARATVASSVQRGYEAEIQGAQDTVNMLFNLGNASGCPSCAALAKSAPCYEHTCKFLTAGGAAAN